MLTRIMLRADQIIDLAPIEMLALEYVLHERLAELSRDTRSGDAALLLAIRAARYLEPVIEALGADTADALLDAVRRSEIGRTALERTTEMAALAEAARAA
jgi:hypothetical protein